jgi:hypothetical protein
VLGNSPSAADGLVLGGLTRSTRRARRAATVLSSRASAKDLHVLLRAPSADPSPRSQ